MTDFRNTPEYFNPRLREGGDTIDIGSNKLTVISIHASAREATKNDAIAFMAVHISIHASAREATIFLVAFHLNQ